MERGMGGLPEVYDIIGGPKAILERVSLTYSHDNTSKYEM